MATVRLGDTRANLHTDRTLLMLLREDHIPVKTAFSMTIEVPLWTNLSTHCEVGTLDRLAVVFAGHVAILDVKIGDRGIAVLLEAIAISGAHAVMGILGHFKG